MSILQSGITKSLAVSYEIDNSVRFDHATNPYLTSPTLGTATSNQKGTLSLWVKYCKLDTNQVMFSGTSGGSDLTYFGPRADNMFDVYDQEGGYAIFTTRTLDLFRDIGAWYHIIWAADTTEAVEADRVHMYVNGTEVAYNGSGSYPSINAVIQMFDTGGTQYVGRRTDVTSQCFGGYYAEFHYVDGQQLLPSAFGETNTITNQWVPIEYEGTYGTNGFYLKFQDSSSLGDDSSGNGNDFTATNLVATDQMVDTPTNNFCVVTPLVQGGQYSSAPNLSEGNLRSDNTASDDCSYSSTFSFSSGKWYWEMLRVDDANKTNIGILNDVEASKNAYVAYISALGADPSYGYDPLYGKLVTDKTETATGFTRGAAGTIYACAVDLDSGTKTIKFYENGSLLTGGTPDISQLTITESGETWVPSFRIDSLQDAVFNFGQDSSFAGEETAQNNPDSNGVGDFYYAPPTDFLALCTDNLPDPEIALPGENFNTILYDDGAGAKTGVGFQPDLVWLKARGAALPHKWTDALRGVTKALSCNSTAAESTDSTGLTAFGADGFTVGADTDYSDITGTGMVAWNWKAGGAPTADNTEDPGAVPTSGSVIIDGVASTAALAGSIAATRLSANTTAGFSIVTYTGTGDDDTVAHGLSITPKLIWVFRRTDAGYFKIISTTVAGLTFAKYFRTDDVAGAAIGNYWQDADPSSSLFSIDGADISTNGSGKEFVGYCWHSVEGYSRVGSYEGNGSLDGSFIYTGFRPAFVMIKSVDSTSAFQIFDDKRIGYNVRNNELEENDITVEDTTTEFIDVLSNGFKNRDTTDPNVAETYIYLAFAKSPFKYSNAR